MIDIEKIAIFQRITDSIKEDVSRGLNMAALGKLDILKGELKIFRTSVEEAQNQPTAAEIVDEPETEVIN